MNHAKVFHSAGILSLLFAIALAPARDAEARRLSQMYHLRPIDAIQSLFSGTFDVSYANHTTSPLDPASEKLFLRLDEQLQFGRNLGLVIGAQSWYDGVYGTDSEYPPQLKSQDSTETRFQDVYAEFKSSHWIIRVGNQQVVWGEALGSFYADVVNPKDFRYGVPLDLGQTRRSIPMANFKYLFGDYSLQAIFTPQPEFNVEPLPGADFARPIPNLGFPATTVSRQLTAPWEPPNDEWGVRATATLGKADLALFNFVYFDRQPYYFVSPDTEPGTLLVLSEQHSGVQSAGATIAWDLDGYIFRSEIVETAGRRIPIIAAGNTLSYLSTNNLNYVASLDFPTLGRWNVSLQVAGDTLSDDANYLTRSSQNLTYGGIHLQRSFGQSSNLEMLLSVTQNSGSRFQIEITNPISSRTEIHTGAEIYGGPSNDDFGGLQRASKVYVSLRTSFHKFNKWDTSGYD